MTVQTDSFPFVWMNFNEAPDHDHDDELADFDRLLEHGARFVILTEDPPQKDHDHSHEEKKRMAVWIKKRRSLLKELVAAMVVVEQNSLKRIAIKSFSPGFQALWGYPIVAAVSREEALIIASELLNPR